MKEVIVRTGCYVYRVGGVVLAREPWAVSRDDNGQTLVRAQRDASEFGVWLGLEAVLDEVGGRIFDFTLRAKADGPVRSETRFVDRKGILSFSPVAAHAASPLGPTSAHFFPLMRYFTGDMVRAILIAGGTKDVIVPDIRTLGDVGSAFAPVHSVRTVSEVKGETDAFDLSGGTYEAPARLYLNGDGLLIHYAFTDAAGQAWTCDLEDGAA
jgi:hypothetical protein